MAKNREELSAEATELGLNPAEFETKAELQAAIDAKHVENGDAPVAPVEPKDQPAKPAKAGKAQEVSSQGVAVFPAGQHPKDLQLAARREREAKDAVTGAEAGSRSAGVVDSVANQVPRGDKLSMSDAASHGAMIKEELRLAELSPEEMKKEQDERATAAGEAAADEVNNA